MIVVTGATGHLGRLVLDNLATLTPPGEIVAGVRSLDRAADLIAAGFAVRVLDYDRPDTIVDALAGAEQVLLISGSEMGRRVAQHAAVIDAAAAAGVEHIAYTSVVRADTSPLVLAEDHRRTEQLISESGLVGTVLRDGWYIENYTDNLAVALEHGTIVGAAGNGRIAAATRADYAAAAAAVLTDETLRGGTFELGGSAFTMTELAAAVSAVVGRPITYTDVPVDTYRQILIDAGLPAPVAAMLADSDAGAANGHLDVATTDLVRLIGRESTPLEQAIAAAVG